MSGRPDPATSAAVAERRCWRCLRMFPGDTSRDSPARAEFWLCDDCERVLLPSKRRAAPEPGEPAGG